MYLMYVDESGDTGLRGVLGNSPTRYFCLTGLIVHELRWMDAINDLLRFRHRLKADYRIYLDDELHASELLRGSSTLPSAFRSLKKHERFSIMRQHAERLINVCVDKDCGKDTSHDQVFKRAWYALFQRFENTMRRGNFPGPSSSGDRGLIFPDRTGYEKRLRDHLDAMRLRNQLFVRGQGGSSMIVDEPIQLLVEHPVCRDSRDSYLIQAVDCAAYMFKQFLDPNRYVKKKGGNAFFRTKLGPVLCTHASNSDPLGIVRI